MQTLPYDTPSLRSFDLAFRSFCWKHRMRYKQFAANAGISYGTLLDVLRGRSPGHELIPKAQTYMAEYEREAVS